MYSVPNTAPATTTQLLAEDQTNPSNVVDTQPRFSAQYNDADVGDTATSYELEIATSSSGFGSPLWDSGKLTLSPSVIAGNQSQDVSYTGTPLALDHTTYYWRIKFWDLADTASPWSSGAEYFTMADDGTHIQSLHYTYDAVGNITGILDDVNGSEQNTYTYDPLNRLTTASSTLSGFQTPYIRTYSYNALGGIATSSDLGGYYYQGNLSTNMANPDAPTSIGNGLATSTFIYDNNGNLTSDGSYNYVWDYLNEMTQAGKNGAGATSTYAFDYASNRVKVTEGGVPTYYPNKYFSSTSANGSTATTTVKNIYANGLLVATINAVGISNSATSTPTLNATTTNFTLGASATTTKSWTHTTSFGTNRLLVLTADILQHVAGTGSISSASYAGIPLTKASSSLSGTMASELWYLIAPPSGNNTISVTVNGATDALKFGLADYTGISRSGLDATSTATGTTGSPVASVTTHLTGDLVTATLSRNSTTAATTNRTSLFNNVASTTLGAASYQVSGAAGSISDTYTGTATQNWAMVIAAFKPATTTATAATSTSIYYIHPDHLGGANALTDSAGILNENLQYYPYGASRTDTLAGTFGGTKRKYLSQVQDSSGLNYLQARYQNPSRGQFLSEDPVSINLGQKTLVGQLTGMSQAQLLENPQQVNFYSYGNDNPLTQSDPKGLYAVGINAGLAFEAGLGLFGAVNLSGGVYFVHNDTTGNNSLAVTSTYGTDAGVTGVANTSYPAGAAKNSGVVGLMGSAGLSGTYAKDVNNPNQLAGVSQNKSASLLAVSYQQSTDSNGSHSYTVGGGVKPLGAISSYPTQTFVLGSASIKSILNSIQTTLTRLQAMLK